MSVSKIYKRQQDLVKPNDLLFPITIIGVGGIGSHVAFHLAKMGATHLTIIDPDKVEEHNIPSQLYSIDDVGTHKVSALQQIINKFSPGKITPIPFVGTVQEYGASELPFGRIVICAVDSLEERRKIWEIIRPLLGGIDLYIDVRMGGEQLRLFCVSPFSADSIVKYQKNMDSTRPADPTPCTMRSITYNTGMSGVVVTSLVKRYVKKESINFEYNVDITNIGNV